MSLTNEIKKAEARIRSHILKTPLLESLYLSKGAQARVYLKLENEQHTGSFKIRGATNKILSLTEVEKEHGVVTASTGNHGQALARALQNTDIKGIVYVPKNADESKVAAIRQYGIIIKPHGTNSLATEMHAKKVAEEQNMVWVSPYNDPLIIAGQGTVGVELAEQLAYIDAVFVTVGGGGLIAGIGTYLKSVNAKTRIIGCMPENSPEMYHIIKTGKYVEPMDNNTLSDGSAGGVEEGAITCNICRDVVDDFILVSEDEIRRAIKLMIDVHHKIIEGAAGVALAAFLQQQQKYVDKTVAIVLCGGNIDSRKLKAILR